MKLAIDVGNTLAKFAVFEGSELLYLKASESPDEDLLNEIINRYPGIDASIIGAVRDLPGGFVDALRSRVSVHMLTAASSLPVTLDYDTPETLGSDRIAGVVAASHLYPGQNVLLIEAGTCITYDLVDAGRVYRGGSISPGMNMRFRALNTFTGKLPLIEAAGEAALTGKTTAASIQSGVINGMIAEMEGIIMRYERIYENLTVVASGGYLNYFDKILKNNIFAVPNIVVKGLNIILEFNEAKQVR